MRPRRRRKIHGPYVPDHLRRRAVTGHRADRTGSKEPLDLVKDLKAHGANTVIGLNWDEKGDPKDLNLCLWRHADGSSSAANIILLP